MRPHAALWLGALLGASLYAYQLSWFVPVLCGLCVLSRPALLRRPRGLVLAGTALATALAVSLPGFLLLRDGLGQVLAQTGNKATWHEGGRDPTGSPVVVTLIAPDDRDVYDPDAWHERILCSTPERAALKKILGLGFEDTFRLFEQPDRSFSWWDYRQAAFRRGMGLRIDLVLASRSMAKRCAAAYIDVEPRRQERPSDHTPVIAEFD